jgi:hypothetical protein
MGTRIKTEALGDAVHAQFLFGRWGRLQDGKESSRTFDESPASTHMEAAGQLTAAKLQHPRLPISIPLCRSPGLPGINGQVIESCPKPAPR